MFRLKNTLLSFFFIVIASATFGQSAKIYVEVENIADTNGLLVIGIFDNAPDFKSKTSPYRATKIEIANNTVSHTFSDVPPGNYAIAVFHDVNEDGKLNTKSMKIPTEGVGVSGKNERKLRPPKFEEVAFRFENDTAIVIQMVYPDSK